MGHPALHDGAGAGVGRVLGIAGPKTVHIPAHLDLIQTVVDAVKDGGAPPAQHDLTVGPADLRLARSQKSCGGELPSRSGGPMTCPPL